MTACVKGPWDGSAGSGNPISPDPATPPNPGENLACANAGSPEFRPALGEGLVDVESRVDAFPQVCRYPSTIWFCRLHRRREDWRSRRMMPASTVRCFAPPASPRVLTRPHAGFGTPPVNGRTVAASQAQNEGTNLDRISTGPCAERVRRDGPARVRWRPARGAAGGAQAAAGRHRGRGWRIPPLGSMRGRR